ncbi:MAG: hypothetical protein JOZ08_15870 [Verrucomicrobia bacterium]|nr:hypothetical protein [Verrucomicrobiota bacterium]MBV8277974.1 hypothetical protein [Verrucomicrobiota bacterium]
MNASFLNLEKECTVARDRAFGKEDVKGEDEANRLRLVDLFNLCDAKIRKYEFQTRSRANWSFVWAVLAMPAGIGLLCWGAIVLFQAAHDAADTHGIISGSIISTVGGAMSAYITKTFLDIHRTSLLQLNHYFKQPVLNSHILSAQRLADHLQDDSLKKQMYQDLIQQVLALIAADQAESEDFVGLGARNRVYKPNVLKGPLDGKPETEKIPKETFQNATNRAA